MDQFWSVIQHFALTIHHLVYLTHRLSLLKLNILLEPPFVMVKTLYFNIEDDVKSIVARLRAEGEQDFVLVFPRRSYLFSDPLNVKMLKKQLDILRKTASIMTMDERGQAASVEAGFTLREIPTRKARTGMGDIAVRSRRAVSEPVPAAVEPQIVEDEALLVAEEVSVVMSPKRVVSARAIPRLAVHDTIFSDVPKRSSFETEGLRQRSEARRKMRVAWLGALALVVIIALLGGIFILPKASVTVYAKADPVVRDLELALATSTTTADVNTLSMPATAVDQTLEAQDKFQTNGKKELGSKATGKVRIFNLTGASINLRASTTTLSANGKTFVFTTDQNYVKPVTAKNVSNPDSGQIAAVVAVEGGEASNLPEGTRLEITNQVFGNKPQLLYAQVDEAFVGGNSRFVSVIEQADITTAQESLTKSVLDKLATDLKVEGKFLAERAYSVEVVDFTTDKPVTTESPTFTAQLKLHVKGLVFDPVTLTELVRSRVIQVLPTGGHLEPASKDTMTFRVREIDPVAGTLRLIVHLESKLYKDIDLDPFRTALVGKSKAEAEAEAGRTSGVDHADIVLWPSWQSSLPRLGSRITVTKQEN